MATFNTTTTAAADLLNSSVAHNGHFDRSGAATTTTFLVPSSASSGAPLQLEPFITSAPHFVTTSSSANNNNITHSPVGSSATHPHHQQQHHHHHQQTNSTSTSYTFVQIKREPCQVSEVTSANCHQQQQQQHHQQHQQSSCTSSTPNGSMGVGIASSSSSSTSIGATGSSKTMSSSTLTTLVKIEASSPKVPDNLDKAPPMTATLTTAPPNTNNSVPIGIAVARKRPQETSTNLSNTASIPVQPTLSKDLNCFGIRVTDLGGVGAGCGNIYFTGNGDLMASSATTAEELALSAAGLQGMNRNPSTFWQYPNALPIDSVISMSPATVGLQYSRDTSRGQVVLLPATPAALGISNFPLYTPTDPFQQAAAAFVLPSYIPQGTTSAAAAATLQPPPNFIFPSMSPHSTLQPQSYATSLQLFGSNYLTAAAAAAAAAAATSTLCQHNQQTNSSTSSINLSLGAAGAPNAAGSSTTSSSSSSSSRFLSLSTSTGGLVPPPVDNPKNVPKPLQPALTLPPPPSAAAAPSLIIPPTAMKLEEWSTTDFITRANSAASALTHHAPPASHLPAPAPALAMSFESRDKTTTTTTTTTNLLDLQNAAANAQQALNLIRLPTPPTSATIETAAVAAAAPQLQPQLLFQTTSTPSPALLNLSATAMPRVSVNGGSTTTTALTTANFLNGSAATLSAAVGPPTPLGDETTALNFKTSPLETQQPQIVVGVPRVIAHTQSQITGPPPQMQDVNIQTDTPVCSEDENSSCPLALQQQQPPLPPSGSGEHIYAQDTDTQQPLELTKPHANVCAEQTQAEANNAMMRATNECHIKNTTPSGEDAKSTEMSTPRADQYNETAATMNSAEQPQSGVADPGANGESHPVVNEPVNGGNTTAVAEDLTGLELLSNISTITLAADKYAPLVRVKQEPIEHMDTASGGEEMPQSLILNGAANCVEMPPSLLPPQQQQQPAMTLPLPPPRPPSPVVELGGLNLLCALAEQRIQEEEVQCGGSGLFSPDASESNELLRRHQTSTPHAATSSSFAFQQQQQQQQPPPFRMDQSFPSMEGIELPSTSGMCGGEPVKRKKHKHSKSSKSSSSASASTTVKKSQRCSKKNKKYAKEKRKHRLLSSDELDFDDEQLREELKGALECGKWPNTQEIFKLMESNMRMRLADITRQYRKKKRKLDEISKNKKKKKCSKLLAAQQQQQHQQQQLSTLSLAAGGLSLVGTSSVGLACGSTSLPLCDYKFPKFSNGGSSTSASSSATPYLNRSAFSRFGESTATPTTHAQFPPPDVDLSEGDDMNSTNTLPPITTVYKPVRLGPSALAGAVAATENRNLSVLRVGQKHPASDKNGSTLPYKERKFMTVSSSSTSSASKLASNEMNGGGTNGDERERSVNAVSPMSLKLHTHSQAQQQQPRKIADPMDRQLMLTSEHLYRKETRVLTDMGGLFYAGIMKPLQPPDVYAITLDGERGNKPHIMSREEIFKDTILEVTPKTIESVPVGTRLCAYWSQQYRCLYPGRAIESESSDDGETPRDFVSVEFDDGDSGRIRLQNIRFLLSDYPIVEYNDNPLYSLGKHKKSGSKAGSSASHEGPFPHEPLSSLVDLPSSTAGDFQMSTAREAHAQRSEKKRIKSLKKKTQAAASAAAAASALTTTVTGESNDCNRKHHKHKKRKKHKKHHRKANAEEGGEEQGTFVIKTGAGALSTLSSSVFIGKSEQPIAAHANDEALAEATATVTASKVHKTAAVQSVIKQEVPAVTNGVIKVKTENLDLEEESTSNMMSEISDENKGDDEAIEHNNSKGSKIAAFLPERQLWGWLGKAYRKAGVKGRARKQFYKTIKRGRETITVGDCAVFLSTGKPDRPYIGRIESMWETTSSNKVVRVRWFYHPEETTGCPNLKYPGALFESPHEDENDVQTISHRCEVLPFASYFAKFGADSKQYQSIYENNDTYYLAGYYNPKIQVLNLQEEIPIVMDAAHNDDDAVIKDNNITALV